MQTVRVMTLSFWTIYILCSRNLELLNQIHLDVIVGGTLHDGLSGFRVAEQVQREVNDVDMELFSVAYISGFIARHVLCAVRCDDCKTCLTSPVTLLTNAFIYFKEYKGD